MSKKYAIEIYPPDNKGDDAVCTIESDIPFLPIQKGDIINPRTWTSHYFGSLSSKYTEEERPYGIVLRVTGIEHFIVQSREGEHGFVMHKLGIFTEAVDDIAEFRP